MKLPRGNSFWLASTMRCDLTADGAEVPVLHGGINIHDAADVIVIQHRHLTRSRDRGDVGQYLRTFHRRRSNRHVLKVLQGLNPVLGGLGCQVIVDAILPIQEKGRSRLKASAQRHQQAAGDVALGEAAAGCFRAVHVDMEFRVIEVLLNARVDDTRYLAYLVQYLVGDLSIALDVGALDLNIDGRGQAKVQNLSDDVGG